MLCRTMAEFGVRLAKRTKQLAVRMMTSHAGGDKEADEDLNTATQAPNVRAQRSRDETKN